jgi:HEAT repeat protein
VARAASRALAKIVHYAGRPGTGVQRKEVAAALIAALCAGQPAGVRRELVWLLSEVGDDEAVPPVAALLSDPELRDDARMVLERLPGIKATAALKAALPQAPEDFKPSLAHGLRALPFCETPHVVGIWRLYRGRSLAVRLGRGLGFRRRFW